MASVQAMPAMQAGVAAPTPNFTQEQVQQAYQVSLDTRISPQRSLHQLHAIAC
jgi:hypothetical protein